METLLAVREAAVRHTRRFLKRVTGRRGCSISLRDTGEDIRIVHSVTAIRADGETIETSCGTVQLTECNADELRDFTRSLNILESKIADGTIKGQYNEQQDTYLLQIEK